MPDDRPEQGVTPPAPAPVSPAQHWPNSAKAWVGIALVGVAGALLAWKGQYEAAILAAGWISSQLGVGGQIATVLTTAGLAAVRAEHAANTAHAASEAAHAAAGEAAAIRETLADNPSLSGLRPSNDPSTHL